MPIADTTRAILRYDEASSAAWEDPRAIRWWSFFAHWRPHRTALQLVRSHSPEICLPAAGRTFVQERPAIDRRDGSAAAALPRLRISNRTIDRFSSSFASRKTRSRNRRGSPQPNEWNARGRLLAVWRGQRNLGQRLLEIAVTGFDDFFRAREAFAATVSTIVEKRVSAAQAPRS